MTICIACSLVSLVAFLCTLSFGKVDAMCWEQLEKIPTLKSGAYILSVRDGYSYIQKKTYCDMVTRGGGWLVILKRFSGETNFNKAWQSYKSGFGDAIYEYWLGNKFLHLMMNYGTIEMLVEITDMYGVKYWAYYDYFAVNSESEQYTIRVGRYSGNAGDGFRSLVMTRYSQNNMPFSTKDADNDKSSIHNCAHVLAGGFWFNACGNCNPTGIYVKTLAEYKRLRRVCI